MKDLTNSTIARQNILNNAFAIEEVQKAVGVEGVVFETATLPVCLDADAGNGRSVVVLPGPRP